MAEYIEREAVLKIINDNSPHDKGGYNTEEEIGAGTACSYIRKAVENIPTADVAPKSEVENILDGLMKEAREIADRYEKSANETSDYDYARIEYRGCQMGALLVLFKIAELKKKYTEGE